MFVDPILVVGAGPAGVSAAVTLAEAGRPVVLVEQRDRPGGAIHRQPAAGAVAHVPRPRRHRRGWGELSQRLAAAGDRIERRWSSLFAGVDASGRALVEDRAARRLELLRPGGIVLALGAIERVLPFPGWELPGVMTAGGAQVLLKETGVPPAGRLLVAGNGPLPVALAAQLAAMGNAPLAVIERGQPLRPRSALGLLAAPAIATEASLYLARLLAARVPYRTGVSILAVERAGPGLSVLTERNGGQRRSYLVDRLFVHDGLRPNDVGLPATAEGEWYGILFARAGDCREVLGADAAILDGALAAGRLLARLGAGVLPSAPKPLASARAAQALLDQLFAALPPQVPDETMLCRCEARRIADLRQFPAEAGGRELRLGGRFGMGACQGRFCAQNTAALRGLDPPDLAGSSAPTPRWPLRPLSIAALVRGSEP